MGDYLNPRARILLMAEYERSGNYRAVVDVRDQANEAYHAPALKAITHALALSTCGVSPVGTVASYNRDNRIAFVSLDKGVPMERQFIGREVFIRVIDPLKELDVLTGGCRQFIQQRP